MKINILKVLISAFLMLSIVGCGDKFLETNYSGGIDIEDGLTSATKIEIALNGTYYRLMQYYFAGNYATNIGDIPTDITYFNQKTGHWDKLYTYTFVDTDTYLNGIWTYGYKVVDNAARIIKGAKELYPEVSTDDQKLLDRCIAEAYALRGYAMLRMVNVYGHQVKVAGTDFSSTPGLVLVDEPIEPLAMVSRATVGETYRAIINDFENALNHFKSTTPRNNNLYFNPASVNGLLARTHLYMENWSDALSFAEEAISLTDAKMIYDPEKYRGLYTGGGKSNTESLFYVAIDGTTNWSANSSGTLWTTYNMSPSPYLFSLYGANDIRLSIMNFDESEKTLHTPESPVYGGGKFHTSNPATATHYLVNLPEMYLIAAEANVMLNDTDNAKTMLLNVAKRNLDITAVTDIPTRTDSLMNFIKEERARELFQEGLRLWDLRRWGQPVNVYAQKAPNIDFMHKDYNISDLVFPIPADEINSGFGVTQNDWAGTLPK